MDDSSLSGNHQHDGVAGDEDSSAMDSYQNRNGGLPGNGRVSTPGRLNGALPSDSDEGSSVPNQNGYHSLSYAFQTYLRDDREEQNHWDDVCRSFRQYATFAMSQWANQQYRLHSLPDSHRQYLPAGLRRDTPEFNKRATAFKEAAIRNQFCLDCILRHAGQPHSQEIEQVSPPDQLLYATDGQMSKVSSVLKSLERDWSVEGKPERDMCYGPILKQLRKHVPLPDKYRKVGQYPGHDAFSPQLVRHGSGPERRPRVCVPGAGLGRLAFDVCSLGYTVQGNEFSLYMLLASDFILNGNIATPANPMKISPFLLESRNVHSSQDATRFVHIPDVDPYSIVPTSRKISDYSDPHMDSENDDMDEDDDDDDERDEDMPDFSMAAGEFVSIYSNPREREQWDAVASCFFLDASPCVVEYLHVIHHMLRPGGVLINYGPLLWHWSGPAMRPDDKTVRDYHQRFSYLDKKYLTSVDLCWEDMREILVNIGFEIIEEHVGVRALYTCDRRSMMNMTYRCVNFVAQKKRPQTGGFKAPAMRK